MWGSQKQLVDTATKGVSTSESNAAGIPSVRYSALEAVIEDTPEYAEQFSYKRFPFRFLRHSYKLHTKNTATRPAKPPGAVSLPVSPTASTSPMRSLIISPCRGGGFVFDRKEGWRKQRPRRLPQLPPPRIYLH